MNHSGARTLWKRPKSSSLGGLEFGTMRLTHPDDRHERSSSAAFEDAARQVDREGMVRATADAAARWVVESPAGHEVAVVSRYIR
jgi:hypothetical protein